MGFFKDRKIKKLKQQQKYRLVMSHIMIAIMDSIRNNDKLDDNRKVVLYNLHVETLLRHMNSSGINLMNDVVNDVNNSIMDINSKTNLDVNTIRDELDYLFRGKK